MTKPTKEERQNKQENKKHIQKEKGKGILRKWNRYRHSNGYFILSLYLIASFFAVSLFKYIIRWNGVFFPRLILILLAALCALISILIVSAFIIWRMSLKDKKEKSDTSRMVSKLKADKSEGVIYIPFGIFEVISIFFAFSSSDREYFIFFLVAQPLIFISYFLWRRAHKQAPNNKYIIVIVSVALTLLASLCASHCIYILYKDSLFLRYISNRIWSFIVPLCASGIFSFVERQSWLIIGITLIIGCLLIVTWAKDTPCKTWNPFSAYDLKLSNNILFTNLCLLMVLLYSIFIQGSRLTFIMFFILFASYITTSVYCNHMQSNTYILEKIKKYLKLFDIKYFGSKEYLILNHSDELYDERNELQLYIVEEYADYVIKLHNISAAIVRNMRHNNCNEQISHSIELIRTIGKQIHNEDHPENIGFLTGLGCIPPEVDDEVQIEDTIIFFARLFSWLKYLVLNDFKPDFGFFRRLLEAIKKKGRKLLGRAELNVEKQKSEVKNAFYNYTIFGMYIGLFALVFSISTSPREPTKKATKVFNNHCEKFEDYIGSNQPLKDLAQELKGNIPLSLKPKEQCISKVISEKGYKSLSTLLKIVYCDELY